MRPKLSLRTSPLGAAPGAEADGFSGASPAAPSAGCFCFCRHKCLCFCLLPREGHGANEAANARLLRLLSRRWG